MTRSVVSLGEKRRVAENEMVVVNSEVDKEIRRVYSAYSEIILDISISVRSMHDSLHIGSTVSAVGNEDINLGAIHCCKPSVPVGLSATVAGSAIAIAPALVVGTEDGILCLCGIAQDDQPVVPVLNSTIVGE